MCPTLEIVSVNLSLNKGTVKQPVVQAAIDSGGVAGDAHAGPGHRQVSLLGQASIDRFAQRLGRPILPGEFGENLTVRGLDPAGVAVLDRFRFGPVELEVTQIGKRCHGQGCAIFQQVGQCVMPLEGVFCRVMHGGLVAAGAAGELVPRPFRFRILTLSDRAAAGVYEDRSGPRARELIETWLVGKRWHAEIETKILPDDAEQLRGEVLRAKADAVDVVITTGGTGVGPRDITPETVAALSDKIIPGIMEHIRVKFGAAKPNALLSRSIAAVAGTTQIYTLPGSVRAVEEYLGEILLTLEHLVLMLHGIDSHG
jgi:molybdenum cofactor synthesis domain-containing protein